MFAWSPSELNGEQEDAVREPGSVFLKACPGSGKTRTLTYKAAYELDRVAESGHYVVAITYTHRAANEITERVEGLGVDTTKLWIGTIHSFCLEWIIRPYGIYHEHLRSGYRVLDIHEREEILEELCEPYAQLKVSHYDCEFYFEGGELIPACRDRAKLGAVRRVLAAYQEKLQRDRLLDFEFMLFYAHELITSHSLIAQNLARIFSHFLIDEYQDTKKIQYEIIAEILRAGERRTNAFIVGDPNQAIYGSLGGYPILVEEFEAMTGLNFSIMSLNRNYRSAARIVGYFQNFRVEDSEIEAASPNRDYESKISYDYLLTRDELRDELIRLIRYNIEVCGIAPKDICVLAPQWVHLASTTRHLSVSLPEYQFDGPGMVPFAKDQENIWFKISRIALTTASPGMYLRRMRWAGEILHDLRHFGLNLPEVDAAELLKVSNSIIRPETDGLQYLAAYFAELFEKFRVDFTRFEKMAVDYEKFFTSSESRIERLRKEGAEFMSDITSFRRVFQTRSGITVSTIHGVKGAEFDAVIAYALLEGMVPHFNDPNGQDSALKLLYVIGSRARKNLHLISERERPKGRYATYTATLKLEALNFDYDEVDY
jgi:DNA helicase-2/ATP-dependent DNA helicase PcrA